MVEYYLWIKAIHVIAVIAWMAGLFYLPRLFVYHCKVAVGSESSELFKVMEERVLRVIMVPSMGAAWLAGLGLIWIAGEWRGWLIVKVAAVVVLSGFHDLLRRYAAQFARDERPRSERYFRLLNEVPTVMMITIVVMVIVKPF
jgi:putative membrane protein